MAEGEKVQNDARREPPGPLVLAINLCDTVIRDELTKKVSLIGLFGVIWSKQFPCLHRQLNVHVAMTGGHGKQEIEVRLLRVSDDKPIIGMRGPMEFSDPLQVAELVIGWSNVPFEKPGKYAIQVCCGKNGGVLASRDFNVVRPDADQSGPDGVQT